MIIYMQPRAHYHYVVAGPYGTGYYPDPGWNGSNPDHNGGILALVLILAAIAVITFVVYRIVKR